MKQILLILFWVPLFAAAQPFLDLASAYFQYGASDKPAYNNTLYTELASVSLNIPLKMDSDYIVLNPVYENFKMIFPLSFTDREFHSGYLPLSWLHRWNEKWNTAFVFIPRLNSQLAEKLSNPDFQYGGAVLTAYRKRENLKYKLGVYYNSEFFGPFVIPLLGIDWNINPRWNLFGVLPGSMNLEYKLRKSIHTGIQFRSITNSYRTFNYNFIRVNDNHLKLFMDFYVARNQVISLEAGHSLFRKYQSGYRRSGAPEYYSMNVTDGYLFRIAYAYRLRLDAAGR